MVWLRSPLPIEDEPFGIGQDFDVIFAGILEGGLIGHLEFYLSEEIPNPSKRTFLLNTIYIMTWEVLSQISQDLSSKLFRVLSRHRSDPPFSRQLQEGQELLERAVAMAQRSKDPELLKWSSKTQKALTRKAKPPYRTWCERTY